MKYKFWNLILKSASNIVALIFGQPNRCLPTVILIEIMIILLNCLRFRFPGKII
jgi:hypothetical protein